MFVNIKGQLPNDCKLRLNDNPSLPADSNVLLINAVSNRLHQISVYEIFQAFLRFLFINTILLT